MGPFPATSIPAIQDYEGASDLDIKPAVGTERVPVSRVFAEAKTVVETQFSFDASHWTATTSIQLDLEDPDGAKVSGAKFVQGSPQGSGFKFETKKRGFHSFFVQSANAPAQNSVPSYRLRVTYTAPQTI